MLRPTAAPESARTKSSPYTAPRGHPGPQATSPRSAAACITASRAGPREPTNTSGARQRGPPLADRAESPRALLAAPHLAAERRQRRGERQPALVVAPVERRDQHDPQPQEAHTST